MAKCLRRVAFLVPWAHRQPPHVAPVSTRGITYVLIKQVVHLSAVMARGMYSIGNRFQITLLTVTLFTMTATSSGALAMVAAEVPYTLSSRACQWSHTSLTCALNYILLFEDAPSHCFSREAGEARLVAAVQFTV
jgi:hypothetical protein